MIIFSAMGRIISSSREDAASVERFASSIDCASTTDRSAWRTRAAPADKISLSSAIRAARRDSSIATWL